MQVVLQAASESFSVFSLQWQDQTRYMFWLIDWLVEINYQETKIAILAVVYSTAGLPTITGTFNISSLNIA